MSLLLRHPLLFLGLFLWIAAAMGPAFVHLVGVGWGLSFSAALVQPLLLSALGGALAGLLTLTRMDEDRSRGALKAAVTGIVACTGATALILGYVALRMLLFPSASTFWSVEFVVMFLFGAAPGLVLASKWFDLSSINARLSEDDRHRSQGTT